MPLPFSLSQLGAGSLESRMGIRDSAFRVCDYGMRACCMAMVEGTGLYFWTLLATGYGYRATAPDCSERAWSMRLGGAPRTTGTRDPGPGTISVRPGSGTMVPALYRPPFPVPAPAPAPAPVTGPWEGRFKRFLVLHHESGSRYLPNRARAWRCCAQQPSARERSSMLVSQEDRALSTMRVPKRPKRPDPRPNLLEKIDAWFKQLYKSFQDF